MSRKTKAQVEPGSAVKLAGPTGAAPDELGYRVVARRYRPQTFDEVVGQDHVVQTLRNAIKLNRVTHAYLFTGTRGVGKTSIARIFAKCLNCEQGPAETPCNTCDMCQAISVGQDVDVIEIDGASNNGVEQVRELRQNANLRPSRGRYKIYYIDEVHSLSKGAFEALLKTLEEPPEHVKFFFATTEPGKIPDTVRSRCQRFDFAGISPDLIVETLASICEQEGASADRSALQTIARRAAGSMRDAQSMLEQALATEGRITDQLVHETLGLAPDERVLELLEAMAARDTAAVLRLLDQAAASGVQPGDLLGALLEFTRDVMVLAAGAGAELLASAPSVRVRLTAVAEQWTLETAMAALQVLAEARGRMRGSAHGRLLVELALCRCSRLADLVEINTLVEQLSGSGEPLPKKKLAAKTPDHQAPSRDGSPRASATNGAGAATVPPLPAVSPAPTGAPKTFDYTTLPLSLDAFIAAWPAVSGRLPKLLGGHLAKLHPEKVPEPGVLVASVPSTYNFVADQLEKPDSVAAIEQAFRQVFGRPVTLRIERQARGADAARPTHPSSRAAKHEDLDNDPLIQNLVKLFDARPVRIQTDDEVESP